MKVEKTNLPGVLKITPDVFEDQRGFFFESFRAERYEAHGIPGHFAQDSVSRSRHGVLRGLHFQWPSAQGRYDPEGYAVAFGVLLAAQAAAAAWLLTAREKRG